MARRDVFQAIADPKRREIIDLLTKKSMTVSEIATHFQVSRPAISKHLKILNECGVIEYWNKGRERYCMINPTELIPVHMWVDQYKNLWKSRIDAFEQYLIQLKAKQNTNE